MSRIFLISDTHFGHAGMCQFLDSQGQKIRPFTDPVQMDSVMIDRWNAIVKPKDKVYHLGDVVINRKHLNVLQVLNGEKVLIKGNHDIFKLKEYSIHFKDIRATHRLANRLLLSHYPVHRDSLGHLFNVHGHLHHRSVMLGDKADPRYINVCVEKINYTPISLESVLEMANHAQ